MKKNQYCIARFMFDYCNVCRSETNFGLLEKWLTLICKIKLLENNIELKKYKKSKN